ncbi:MAG: hypothetical protein PHC78_05900 [Verrucomicrobiota bacterium]|nr:hypothetical protein [Verrucomicrobiota bacterium]
MPKPTHHLAARLRVLRRRALWGLREGRRVAARLGVLLHGAWWPRARSEVRCGWGKSIVVADVEPDDEKKLMVVGCGWCEVFEL